MSTTHTRTHTLVTVAVELDSDLVTELMVPLTIEPEGYPAAAAGFVERAVANAVAHALQPGGHRRHRSPAVLFLSGQRRDGAGLARFRDGEGVDELPDAFAADLLDAFVGGNRRILDRLGGPR